MNKNLPDKWIRKAVYDAINNISVDGNIIPCYDSKVTGRNKKPHYVLITTQNNIAENVNKCEKQWRSFILLDIVTTYKNSGNTGSRLLADNILDEVRNLTDNLTLDVSSGLKIVWQKDTFPNDIVTITDNNSIYRKFLRIELYIN